MQWLLIVKLVVLLTVANGAPIIATKLFGRFLNQQLDCGAAFIIASAAMVGDLSSSFLKRRLNLPPSSRATGIDQVPECLLPAMVIRSTLGLTAFDVVSVVIIFFLGEVLLSRLLFNWNIRDHPY